MPTPAYIVIEGTTQGLITAGAFTPDSVGNVYVEGHENEILAQEIKHQVTVPTDPQSGQPAGQRVHKPFIFTCALNKAIPLMYQALVTGEVLPMTTIRWYRTSAEGKQEHFFTTELVDAIIVNINTVLPHAQDKENEHFTQLVEVSMSYRAISWEHKASGTAASDDWRKPIAASAA
ncbi:Hcp family type VI secretion system effector [Pseudomonas sp. S 311-6]|uniref:Hcp family type VI secretion system effector n=1 Tax=Pseudomonas TaxID=286 RepID=UPI002097273F|nr:MULTISPECIES: Hcp family type VI secretion system effector [Pseudomonas]MCO7567087.1 Hcp family type VI secretion system effector [Pseudomonas mosselii]MCO7618646.1 Hcp family type VI secretion system effector [Pseudomonas guariconensis]MCO7637685.1 Hcp family type VI secretion system effector [Pseudomonas sp. S 311-6]